METLLLLTYAALCFCAFRFLPIPVNKWTVPTAILGGVGLVAGLVTLMNFNHPYSNITRSYFTTTPLIPTVAGKVATVDVAQNSFVRRGTILLTLDATPFEQSVKSIEAQLRAARPDLARVKKLFKQGAVTAHDLDVAQAQVDELEANLITAEYNLSETTVKAPSDGYVTQLIVRAGMRASNMPFRPLGIFVNQGDNAYIGWFAQNNILRIEENDEAEVAFDAIPGRVFKARVKEVMPAISQGQLQPSGNLIGVTGEQAAGRVPVILIIYDPDFLDFKTKLPAGAFAQSAIYTQHVKEVIIMRKVLLRMNAWLNYVLPIH